MITDIWRKANAIENDVITFRRDLHQIPELSFELPETTHYVESVLRAIGIENIRTGVGRSGIIADIHGEQGPGKTLALRADMDALPIQEPDELPFHSRHTGFMHACGHDGHTAMLLATAKVLWNERKNFRGTVRLVFQPAEEGPPPGGSHAMILDGAMEGVDAIYGCHLVPDPDYPAGSIFFHRTVSMSALDCFTIALKGKGGHGAMPHNCIDAITLAAQVINGIQYIVSRQSDPMETVCITIGTINGGSAWNVIADSVTLSGTMRSYNQETRRKAIEDLRRVVRTSCENVGAAYEFNHIPAVGPIINNEYTSDILTEVGNALLGPEKCILMSTPAAASDDFSNFALMVPGTYYRLCCCSGPETAFTPHSPKYRMDESVLKNGVAINLGIVNRYLNQP